MKLNREKNIATKIDPFQITIKGIIELYSKYNLAKKITENEECLIVKVDFKL